MAFQAGRTILSQPRSVPQNLLVFNATTGNWTPQGRKEIDLTLPPGGGVFVGPDAR